MKRLALAITILGIVVLLILLNSQSPIAIKKQADLESLPDNTKIQVRGKVISERYISESKILKLDNNVEIICKGCPPYLNQTIIILGITEHYQNKTQIQALRITHKL